MLFIYFSSLPAEKSKNIEMEKSRKEELYVNKHAIRRVSDNVLFSVLIGWTQW